MGEMKYCNLDNNYIAKSYEIPEELLAGRAVCDVIIKVMLNYKFYQLA